MGSDGSPLLAEAETIEEPGWASARTRWHPCPSEGWSTKTATARSSSRMRDPSGHGDGKTTRPFDRTDAARPARGAHHRLRDRLRGPQPDLDFPVQRYGPPGGGLSPRDECCSLETRRTCTIQPGGQGLELAFQQEAVNLGWKLAQVIRGTSPDSLLYIYQAERHPVGARVLRNSLAQVALAAPGLIAARPWAKAYRNFCAWTSRVSASPG